MPNSFTPQQIEQFLQEFFDVVGARQYIGARYVPIFGRAGEDTVEWDDRAPYEPLTVVMHQGVSYVSRRYVPTGTPITDTDFWVETYRFNAQVEQYRQEVLGFSDRIDMLQQTMESDYVPFPDSDVYPKYGSDGQVLTTLSNGKTRWDDPVHVTSDIAEPLIDEWLDAHPEATTTVQDNSVGTAKLMDGAVTTPKLGNGAVTNAKIAKNTIDNDKLEYDGVVSQYSPARLLELRDITYSVGFIDAYGNVNTSVEAYPLYRYANEYIEAWRGDRFRFTVGKGNGGTPWLKLAVYDAAEQFVARIDINTESTISNFYVGEWLNNYNLSTAPYLIKPTFKVDTQGDDWFFSISKLPSFYETQRTIEIIDNGTHLLNGEQSVIDLPINHTFIQTGSDGSTLSLTPSHNDNYSSHVIVCSAGDRFSISGTGGSSVGGRRWVFLDSSNVVISGASIGGMSADETVTAPDGAAKLLVVFNITSYGYKVVRGYGGDTVLGGTVLSAANSMNHYINTGSDVQTVDPTPVYYRGYTWAMCPCDAGDQFTIYARGGDSGRAWAFVSNNDNILERARAGESCNGTVITAPAYARYLIVNSEANQFRCYRNAGGALNGSVEASTIPEVQICEMPKDVVAMPTVENLSQVEETLGVSVAKTAIYKNGSWFLVTYGQNVDGTGTDIPLIGGTGCLEMVYKRFKLVGGVVSDVQYGRIARIGDSYTDYDGNNAVMTGGCGLPSGIDNLQFFTTPYTVDNGDASYDFAGRHNYGFTPCCCTVGLASDGTVTFGTMTELRLVVGGVSGKFDLHRVDPLFQNDNTYVTTAPPTKVGQTYYWAQVVTDGVAILTSQNGVSWTYATTIRTPYQPRCEVVISSNLSNQLLLGVRTNRSAQYMTNTLYLTLLNINNYQPVCQYQIPFVESRTQIVKSGDEWLLFNPTNDKAIVDVIRICKYGNVLRFWKWFTIYVKPTWYVTCYQPSVSNLDFTDMYLAGGNSSAGSTAGLSFMHLSFDGSEPHSPLSIPASVG